MDRTPTDVSVYDDQPTTAEVQSATGDNSVQVMQTGQECPPVRNMDPLAFTLWWLKAAWTMKSFPLFSPSKQESFPE